MHWRSLIVLIASAAMPLSVVGQRSHSIPVGFVCHGDSIQGRFFPSALADPLGTLILVPGWPGDPQDVLGLGAILAGSDINVLVFNPRGMHASEGTFSFANSLEDIGAALEWLKQAETRDRFHVDTTAIVLGGHSFGGAIALAYAAADSSVRHVISIAGNDLGWYIRKMVAEPQYGDAMRRMLLSTKSPNGPVRFDLEAGLRDFPRIKTFLDCSRMPLASLIAQFS